MLVIRSMQPLGWSCVLLLAYPGPLGADILHMRRGNSHNGYSQLAASMWIFSHTTCLRHTACVTYHAVVYVSTPLDVGVRCMDVVGTPLLRRPLHLTPSNY